MTGSDDRINDKDMGGEGQPTGSYDGIALGPGVHVGQFRIEREIGRGAMGVVFLANDSKLNRQVAIKSLPPELVTNHRLRSRFTHEARALASVNHPNIATIYEVLDDDPQRQFLILEYVPGDTLADLIRTNPLRLKKALDVATQTAEAVAAAHETGIIHRDLKPGNIKITPNGKVKVLDFGLAKAVKSQGPDEQSTLTQPGRIIGTPAYMSPEQARGKEVDRRTDIWSFGCCLFEMLTAKPPFSGETVSDLISAVLNDEPHWSLLPPETPPEVLTLLRRCLEKEPRRRLCAIGDIALTLDETIHSDKAVVRSPLVTRTPKLRPSWQSRLRPAAVGLVLGLSLTALLYLRPRKPEITPDQIRSLAVLPFEALGSDPNLAQFAQWIPDDISVALQKLNVFDRVPPWSLTKTLANASPAQVSQELDVQGFVQGRVRLEGTELSINLELIHATSNTRLWADSFRTIDNDIEGLKRRMVLDLLRDGLSRPLAVNEEARLGSQRKVNRKAYAAYRRGLEHMFTVTAEGVEQAIAEFTLAREIDPNFIDPLVILGDLEWWKTWMTKTPVTNKEGIARAQATLAQAIQKEPNNGAALWAQGILAMMGDWDWKLAKASFEQAIAADPYTADYYEGLALVASKVEGRFTNAIEYIERGLALHPDNPPVLNIEPYIYRYHGHYDRALDLHRSCLQRNPTNCFHQIGIAICLAGLGRFNESLEAARKAVTISDELPYTLSCMATICAQSKDFESARMILNKMKDQAQTIYVSPFLMAQVYAWLRDWDEAFDWLEKGYEQGAAEGFIDLRSHRNLTLMGDQRRYWDMVDRMKFPALPIEHDFYEREQQMRFGKGASTTVQFGAPATCTEIRLPDSAPLALTTEVPKLGFASRTVALSSNGCDLVYVGKAEQGTQLFHQDLTGFDKPRQIEGTEGAHFAFFSPSSTELGFLTSDRVGKVNLDGGAPMTLCRARVAVTADWIGDIIYFTDHEGGRLSSVPADGGEPTELFNVMDRCQYWGRISCVLPDGNAALVSIDSPYSNNSNYAEIQVVPFQGTGSKPLSIRGFDAIYLASGHLVYGRSGGIWAAPFDSTNLRLTGKAVPVLEGVAVESMFGNAHVAIAENGTAAFTPGHDLAKGRLAWMDRQGNEGIFEMEERAYGVFDVSSDDRRFAIEVTDVESYISIWDTDNGERALAPEGSSFSPIWSPDGKWLAIASRQPGGDKTGVVLKEIDTGAAREIPLAPVLVYPESWPGSESISVTIYDAVSQIGVLNPSSSQNPQWLSANGPNSSFMGVLCGALSPDANWIAYTSNEGTGQYQVWIEQINGDARRQVSTDGGMEPVWCRTGELFYRQGNRFLASRITLEPKLGIDLPQVVFEAPGFVDTKGISYRVSSDGERLFYIRRAQNPTTDRIHIMHNWFSELARLAPINK